MGYVIQDGALTDDQKAILVAVLSLGNDRRGGDSCGWWTPESQLVHEVGDLAPHATKLTKTNFLIGHTRKATTGKATKENAHPFDIGHIIGAHNGIISNHQSLNTRYKRECSVDSMHIFHHINEGKDVGELSGYGAVEYLEKEDLSAVRLCKMSGGDLAIYGIGTDHKDCKGVIWASDSDHIKTALKVTGIKAFSYEPKVGEVYLAKPDGLYQTDVKLEIGSKMGGNWGHFRGHDDDFDYAQWEGQYYRNHGTTGGTQTGATDTSEDEDDAELNRLIAAFKEKEKERLEFEAKRNQTPSDSQVIEGEAKEITVSRR